MNVNAILKDLSTHFSKRATIKQAIALSFTAYATWKVAKYGYNYLRYYSFYRGMPTPGHMPFLGSVLQLDDPHNIYNFLCKVVEDYSEYPFVVFWNFSEPTIMPMHPAAFEAILMNNTAITKGYYFIENWAGDGLIVSGGDKWRKHRKLLTNVFSHDNMVKFLPVFNAHGKDFVERLQQFHEKEFELFELTAEMFLNILMTTLMGLEKDDESVVTKELKLEQLKTVQRLSDLCIIHKFDIDMYGKTIAKRLGRGREFYRLKKKFDDFTRLVLKERAKKFADKAENSSNIETHCLIDFLLHLKYSEREMEENDIIDELHNFMFAGFDTVTVTFCWVIHFLASNPHVQDKLLDEFKRMKDVIKPNGELNISSIEDLNKLPYLDCVIKESQRLMPTVPVTGRVIDSNTKLKLPVPDSVKDHPIDKSKTTNNLPSGSRIFITYLLLHRNPYIWGDDVLEFKPERFILENSKDRDRFAFIPFAAGPRNCLGQRLALIEVKIMLIYVLSNYSFSTEQKCEDAKPFIGLTSNPSAGMIVKATRLSK